jgi:hypothetical protein
MLLVLRSGVFRPLGVNSFKAKTRISVRDACRLVCFPAECLLDRFARLCVRMTAGKEVRRQ